MLISLVFGDVIFYSHFVLVVFVFYCFSRLLLCLFVEHVSAIASLVLSIVLYHCFLYCVLTNKDDDDDDVIMVVVS